MPRNAPHEIQYVQRESRRAASAMRDSIRRMKQLITGTQPLVIVHRHPIAVAAAVMGCSALTVGLIARPRHRSDSADATDQCDNEANGASRPRPGPVRRLIAYAVLSAIRRMLSNIMTPPDPPDDVPPLGVEG